MTDPPPKKVGSLRDRIAAFENKGGAPPVPAPAPAPRPKPGNLTWQPKPTSPPASPKQRDVDEGEGGAGKKPGMSAADAKESIGKLSLKERMAALQGSTAFGGGAPPPRPTGEKPKWKPPPVVQKVEPIGGDEEEKEQPVPASATSPSEDVEQEADIAKAPPAIDEAKNEGAGEEQKEQEAGEPDEEEEERQRRAALAARMARLGGARVGMGPPVFGKKPDLPPKRKSTREEEKPPVEEKPHEEAPKEEEKTVEAEGASITKEVTAPGVVVSPPLHEAAATELPPSRAEDSATQGSGDYFAVPEKQDSASSTLSPESATSPPVRSPAMPVPLAPKRAAPPRRRAAKSPARPPPVVEQEHHDSPSSLATKDEPELADQKPDQSPAEAAEPQSDREPEVTNTQVEHLVEKAVDDVAVPEAKVEVTEEPAHSPEAPAHEAPKEAHELESQPSPTAEAPTSEPPSPVEVPAPVGREAHENEEVVSEPVVEKDEPLSEEPAAEPEPSVAESEEEDEAARRKRIAERLARSGGFNPFAGGMPPPLRRDSAESARSPPPPIRRDSHPGIARSPPPPVRRDSRPDDSVRSPASTRRDSQQEVAQSPVTSAKPELPERKASVSSVQSGVEVPARKASLDGGVSTEPRVSDYDYEHEHEQSTPRHDVHAQAIVEALEDEDEATEARGERESAHEKLAEDEEREAYEDSDNHRFSRETQDESETIEEEANEPSPQSPPPPPARRPLPTPPAAANISDDHAGTAALSPPPPPRRDFPPPPVRAAVPPPPLHARPVDEEDFEDRVTSPEPEEEDAYTKHAREVGPEHEDEQHESHDVEEEDEHAYYSGHSEASVYDDAEQDTHGREEFAPPPPPPRHAAVRPPPPPVDEEEEERQASEEEEPVPPPPPRRSSTHVPPPPRRSSTHVPPPPTHVPPPPPARAPPPDEDEEELLNTVESEDNAEEEEPAPPPPPPRHPRSISSMPTPLDVSGVGKPSQPSLRGPTHEHEILDDSDGDPIDPAFYSPRSPGPQKSAGWGSLPESSPASSPPPQPPTQLATPPPPPPPQRVISPPPPPPQRIVSPPPQRVVSPPIAPERAASPPSARIPPPPPVSARPDVAEPAPEQIESKVEDDVDAEQARRRTIADRMAKLGGIRFGAPPPVPAVRRPVPAPEPQGEHEGEEEKPAEAEEAPPAEEEEDEFARKQRIAARIAGMGGMRFGMLPGAPAPKPAPRVHREEEEESVVSPPPPKRSAPVPPPPPPPAAEEEDEPEGESDYQHVSDSDRAGHEESELEEVTHADAEEDAPPPVPNRGTRRVSTGPPPVPQGLASPPPVPRSRPPPPFGYPPPPHVPPPPTRQETQGDFVLIDQAETTDEPPPPPPPRAARPPTRAPPAGGPSIPSIDFGGETDLSLSGQWSEDSTSYPPTAPAASAPAEPPAELHLTPAELHLTPAELHLTPDELQAHWGRVGVQVHEISASFYEKSKKSVVGDGSYRGFVNAVLSHVPNAAQPTDSLDSFGYLVYSQSAAAVHRRVSDIMPGDVVVVYDAKFKGHKGLQSYHQSVGVGEPLVGIIGDFESKKSKVKVFQANQHVGQQSVESVSYRLEDLKSGSVKIFRVLEA